MAWSWSMKLPRGGYQLEATDHLVITLLDMAVSLTRFSGAMQHNSDVE